MRFEVVDQRTPAHLPCPRLTELPEIQTKKSMRFLTKQNLLLTSPRSSLLAVYEESLKKTKQERARLEQQAKEVQEQLSKLGDERAEIQEVVRQLISQFGKGTHIKAANAIATKPREGAVAAVRAEVQALEEIRRSKDSHPTHHSR